MKLGHYIKLLEQANPDKIVANGLGKPNSWRGRYSELMFEPIGETTVAFMLKEAKKAVGATYTGWKGGEFTMGLETEIHVESSPGSYSDNEMLWKLLLELMLA